MQTNKRWRQLPVRHTESGFPTIPASRTSTSGAEAGCPRAQLPAIGRRIRAMRSIECSSDNSLFLTILTTDHCNEQVRDTWLMYVPNASELLPIDAIEQHYAAAQRLSLMQRLKRARRREMLGMHRDFEIARLEFLHTAVEHDPA